MTRLYSTLERYSSNRQTTMRDGPDLTFSTLDDALGHTFAKSGESELEQLEIQYTEAVKVIETQLGCMQILESEYISVLNTACHYMLLLLNEENVDATIKKSLLATLPDLKRIMKRSLLHIVIPDEMDESEQTTLARKTLHTLAERAANRAT